MTILSLVGFLSVLVAFYLGYKFSLRSVQFGLEQSYRKSLGLPPSSREDILEPTGVPLYNPEEISPEKEKDRPVPAGNKVPEEIARAERAFLFPDVP